MRLHHMSFCTIRGSYSRTHTVQQTSNNNPPWEGWGRKSLQKMLYKWLINLNRCVASIVQHLHACICIYFDFPRPLDPAPTLTCDPSSAESTWAPCWCPLAPQEGTSTGPSNKAMSVLLYASQQPTEGCETGNPAGAASKKNPPPTLPPSHPKPCMGSDVIATPAPDAAAVTSGDPS